MTQASISHHVPADHPAFAGHFPGQPLLPGVLLLAQVLEAAGAQPDLAGRLQACSLQSAKFLSPVRPDSWLDIRLRWSGSDLHFEVRCGDTVAAKGQWLLSALSEAGSPTP